MPFTTPKLFSEVCKERSEIAKASGDMEEAAFWAPIAERAERVSKVSPVERAGNIIAQRLAIAKPPSRDEGLDNDDLAAAITYALRRVYPDQPEGKITATKFDEGLAAITKADPGQVDDWYEKSYVDESLDPVDVKKRARVMDVIDGKAEEIRKSSPELTRDQAITKAVEAHPTLYDQYTY